MNTPKHMTAIPHVGKQNPMCTRTSRAATTNSSRLELSRSLLCTEMPLGCSGGKSSLSNEGPIRVPSLTMPPARCSRPPSETLGIP